LPNLQRVEAFKTGESPLEQFGLAIELETRAVSQLHEAIPEADRAGDHGTAEMLRKLLVGEERQLDWFETQVQLIHHLGEPNYLAQQVRS
jgi:bacterioferritin